MYNKSVITDYSRLSDKEVETLAFLIYNSLKDNPNFNWGNNEIAQLLTLSTNYRTAFEKALTGTSQDVTAKNIARKALTDFIRILGKDVNLQANGDLLKLQSSGFELSKDRSKLGVLPKPSGLKVTAGDNPGEIIATTDAFTQATVYLFFVAVVPTPASIKDWQVEMSTSHKKKISGLTSGKQLEVKCAYKGTSDELIYSDSVFIYVQ
ncbi:MAG: hypothetical protein Q8928_03385 [Bacteroidota bacterium]|nr:hypothetical protein [Bacteroidota bacterium]